MNPVKTGFIIALALFLSGCATPQRMYDWGDYSNTLYQSKKHPSDQTLLNHQQALEKIIEESGKKQLRIPPGVHAELGYLYFRQNKKELAIRHFGIEKQLYPESALLMERLENAAKRSDKPGPSATDAAQAPPTQPDKQEKR